MERNRARSAGDFLREGFARARRRQRPRRQAHLARSCKPMKPETLKRLLELKNKFPGAIDLHKVVPCLECSEAPDKRLDEYIEKMWAKLRLREYVVKMVKWYQEREKTDDANFDRLYEAYNCENPFDIQLSREQLYEVLVELSSPLTGYLGRKEGIEWDIDRFYFLRNLVVDGALEEEEAADERIW